MNKTNSLSFRHLPKWDHIVSSHLNYGYTADQKILFIEWMMKELEQVDEYGMLIRVRCFCVQGHEWVRDTMRRHMELEVNSAHVELADVMRTFSCPESSYMEERCAVCENMYETVSQRQTLAEQPCDLFVIKLMDYAVSTFT
jgi:hypothetical protein